MDKFRAMQTFVAIAEQGSLTAASRTLASSLPAVVRSLAGLEAHLGVRLFQRTTRRISLTDEGRRYLDNCRQVLGAVAEGETALSANADEPAGHLTVTAPVPFGQLFVAPAVTRFVRRHFSMSFCERRSTSTKSAHMPSTMICRLMLTMCPWRMWRGLMTSIICMRVRSSPVCVMQA